MSVVVIDAAGEKQNLNPDIEWYKSASAKGITVEQHVNSMFQANNQYGTPYRQMLAGLGIALKTDKETGLRPMNMKALLSGDGLNINAAASNVGSNDFASAALRTIFPSAVLTAMEDRLIGDLEMNANAFDSMVAVEDTIAGDRFERPVLDFSKTGKRSQGITQLSEPNAMLTITTSKQSHTIPTNSIGLTISDQAQAVTSLDMVSLALARQQAVERAEQADEYFISMLSGDPDYGMEALSGTEYSIKAQDLDAGITGAGELTQAAWIKFLYRNSKKRNINWVVTDLAGAMAIENRTGKPTNSNDNPNSPRIDSVLEVGNPTWNPTVKVFIMDPESGWPANTIMGLDTRIAIHRVRSSEAQYEAVEQFVLRKAKSLRIDSGEMAYRLYDEAFDVLNLVV
jgi:hypothetical protein